MHACARRVCVYCVLCVYVGGGVMLGAVCTPCVLGGCVVYCVVSASRVCVEWVCTLCVWRGLCTLCVWCGVCRPCVCACGVVCAGRVCVGCARRVCMCVEGVVHACVCV